MSDADLSKQYAEWFSQYGPVYGDGTGFYPPPPYGTGQPDIKQKTFEELQEQVRFYSQDTVILVLLSQDIKLSFILSFLNGLL